jgi:hypothetical protein
VCPGPVGMAEVGTTGSMVLDMGGAGAMTCGVASAETGAGLLVGTGADTTGAVAACDSVCAGVEAGVVDGTTL